MSNSSPSSSSSSPIWLYSYIKLRFFNRIRRFMRSKAGARKNCPPSDQFAIKGKIDIVPIVKEEEAMKKETRTSEVSVISDRDDDVAALQRAVKRLHFGSWLEKEAAAVEVEGLAKEDVKLRKLVAELGVIPVLVNMAASTSAPTRRVAVEALIQLACGTYTNKALIVEAGILSKLPNDTNLLDEPTKLGFSELLLTLSSLSNTPFPLSPSSMIPFLMQILESTASSADAKRSCLGALYNLSTALDGAVLLATDSVVGALLTLGSTKTLAEKALAALGNLVVTATGKKAMENSPSVPASLIEILTWEDESKCQESSAYILMILAHRSSAQREKMAALGIVTALLQVALLGSSLAQKRALKLLQWFRDERQARVGPHSGPQTPARMASMGSPSNRREREEGKKMMKSLVRQSLHRNMEVITRRANFDSDGDESSKLKALVISTSSKSLPY